MSATFRAPILSDAFELAKLGRETFVETFAHLYSAADLEQFLDESYDVEAIKKKLVTPKHAYQIAELDGVFVGYCKVLSGLELELDVGNRKVMQLNQLYVKQQQQGSGIAHILMLWALEIARQRGVQDMYLSVFCENSRAQRFYQSYGFSHIGDTTFMVGKQVDHELIYHKKLI